MNDFYQLPVAELEKRYEALARKALPLWGIDGASPMSLLKIRENGVYSVLDEARSKKYVVRVHRADYHSDAELRSELQWMDSLREYGVLTPSLLYSKNDRLFEIVASDEVPEPRQVDVVDWIEGRELGNLEAGLHGRADEIRDRFETLGSIMAKMHNHAERWQEPEGFTRHSWDVDGLTGDQPFWGRFWELPALSAGQKDRILQVRDKLRRELTEFGAAPHEYGLIHADLLFENVLVGEDGVRVIDFDDCGYGWYLFDLVTSLFFLQTDKHFDLAKAALIAGYRKNRQLTDEHLAWLPVMFMARATTYLGWMHTRSETETAREMTPFVIELAFGMVEDYLDYSTKPRG